MMVLALSSCIKSCLIGPCRRVMVVAILIACARWSLGQGCARLTIALLGARLLLLLHPIAYLSGSLMLNLR